MTDAEIFRANILSFNKQLTPAVITAANLEKLKGINPDSLIIVGMGGSGTPATILQNIAAYANIKIPIISWKNFGLPASHFERPLYVFISFSGNTRETLSGFENTPNNSLKAVVAGGGQLLEKAKQQNLPYAAFDQARLQPRQAYGLTLYGLLTLLNAALPTVSLPDFSHTIAPANFEAQGKELAQAVKDTTLFIYTSTELNHIGQIFKIHCNESGKLLAAANVFPEINHNELSAFETKPKNVSVLFITTKAERAKIEKEINIIKTILTEYEIPMRIIEIPGANPLEVTANAIVLAEWVGYYVATLRGLNPLGINTVRRIKELAQ